MTTAAEVITNAMRLFGIIDQTETAGPTDITNNIAILTNLMRNEQADGACQYLMRTVKATIPAGAAQQIYTFSIGIASNAYAVQEDACALKSLWVNDTNLTVNRETRQAPKADVVRTLQPGIITKWHQERQSDGSVLVTAWQSPNRSVPILLDLGLRFPALTDGNQTIALPPEGIHDATLLLGRRIYKSYGVVPQPTDVIFQDAERVNMQWRDWARGQQWLRFVRS